MYVIIVINYKEVFVDNQKNVILDFNNKSEIPQILLKKYSLILLRQEKISDDFVVISAKSDLKSSISTLEFSDALQMIKKCRDIRIREQARRFLENSSYKKDSKILLAFGIRDNHVVCINDVTENERGEKCKCYCPACEMPLLARLGNGKKNKTLCS